jgi:hypothetical protein
MKNTNLNNLLVSFLLLLYNNCLNLMSRTDISDIIRCAENLDHILTKIYNLSSKHNLFLKFSLLLTIHYSDFINLSFVLQQLQGLFIIFLTSILWNRFKIHFNYDVTVFFTILFLCTILIMTGISMILSQPVILLLRALGKIYLVLINWSESEGEEGSAGKKPASNRPDPDKPPGSEGPDSGISEEQRRKNREWNQNFKANETPEQKKARLAHQAEYDRWRMENETVETRKDRLAKQTQRNRARRAKEKVVRDQIAEHEAEILRIEREQNGIDPEEEKRLAFKVKEAERNRIRYSVKKAKKAEIEQAKKEQRIQTWRVRLEEMERESERIRTGDVTAEMEQAERIRIANLRAEMEQAETDRIANLRAEMYQAGTSRTGNLTAEMEQAETDRIANLRAEMEQTETDRIANLRAEMEQTETDRIANVRAEMEQAETDRIANVRAEMEQAEKNRIEQQQRAKVRNIWGI